MDISEKDDPMPNLNRSNIAVPDITVHLDDGSEHVAKPSIGDMAKYDILRVRKGWPKRDDAEVLFITVLAWIALRRTGSYKGQVDDFIDQLDSLETDDDEETEDTEDADDDGVEL